MKRQFGIRNDRYITNRLFVARRALISIEKGFFRPLKPRPLKDSIVHLYTGKAINNKRGNIHFREELVEEPFRLIVAKSKEEENRQYWFISNNFELSAKEIADAYRRRWDIEVFFRFIKQELNVSHPVSLNRNGMEVMLYMTLIVAILLLMYKHANNIRYKTAKRRFSMEMRNHIISMIVVKCAGNSNIFFKT